MMIGGNAVFSIKVAALLWFLAGYLKFAPGGRESRDSTPALQAGVNPVSKQT